MGYRFQSEQWVPYPAEAVFAFFANPENLPVLMPKWQKARLEQVAIMPPPRANTTTAMAGTGSRVTLSFRPFRGAPFRVRWEAEITDFALNSHFTDRQVKGPFEFWSHTHRIRSVDRAGINITVIIDQVEYEPPMGFLGRIANAWFLHKQLESAFAYRQARLVELLPLQMKPVVPIHHQQQPQPAKPGKLTA
jgi:ligand-binding SRPBCC domain-containing protein